MDYSSTILKKSFWKGVYNAILTESGVCVDSPVEVLVQSSLVALQLTVEAADDVGNGSPFTTYKQRLSFTSTNWKVVWFKKKLKMIWNITIG
jgi:hypothetical protein